MKEKYGEIIKKEGARTLRGRMLNFEEENVLDMTEGNAFNSTVVVPPAINLGLNMILPDDSHSYLIHRALPTVIW